MFSPCIFVVDVTFLFAPYLSPEVSIRTKIHAIGVIIIFITVFTGGNIIFGKIVMKNMGVFVTLVH